MENSQTQPKQTLRGFARWTPEQRSEVARKHAASHPRGFASMSPERRREIASRGGRCSQGRGTAHRWTSDEAQEAGRKGGKISRPGTRKKVGQ